MIRDYDVLDEERNVAYRSTFVIDRDGVLRWGQAGDRQMVRDGREVLYRPTPEPMSDAVAWMAEVGGQWDDRLAALERRLAGRRG